MRIGARLAMTLLLLVAVKTAKADELLWDNYPGGLEALQNVSFNMSSERNTAVWESTWIVDDVDFAQIEGAEPGLTTLTRLAWVGARDPGYAYSTVDVVVLDGEFNTIFELWDLEYSFTDHDSQLDPGMQLYEGEVALSTPAFRDLGLSEHFYIGVRLVGDAYYQGSGRFVTSSIDETIRGQTEGYTRAAVFGAPDWTPASDVWYAPPSDEHFEFAFRVYADVVPEPASLALLAVGGVLMIRRR